MKKMNVLRKLLALMLTLMIGGDVRRALRKEGAQDQLPQPPAVSGDTQVVQKV